MIMRGNDRNPDCHPLARPCAWVAFVALATTFFFQLVTGYRFTDVPQTSTTYAAGLFKYAESSSASEDDEVVSTSAEEPTLTRLDLAAD